MHADRFPRAGEKGLLSTEMNSTVRVLKFTNMVTFTFLWDIYNVVVHMYSIRLEIFLLL